MIRGNELMKNLFSKWRVARVISSLLVLTFYCYGQGVDATANPPGPMDIPNVRFEYHFAESEHTHYIICVDSEGHGAFVERADDPQSLPTSFTVSAANRARIFSLAQTANYFDGNFDYTKSRIAFTGDKTFTYIGRDGSHSTKINWSEDKSITELLALFQGMATTLVAEPKLRRMLKYDRLGLNAQLGILERQAADGWAKELHIIANVLRDIINDRSVMDLARHRAQHLLALAEAK